MREPVDVSGSEDKASAKLKRVLPQLVLMMAGSARALSALGVVAAKQMQKIRGAQTCRSIGLAMLVDQQGEGNTCLIAKQTRVVAVTEPNSRERSSFVLKRVLVFAQLRDMLAAKDSTVMT